MRNPHLHYSRKIGPWTIKGERSRVTVENSSTGLRAYAYEYTYNDVTGYMLDGVSVKDVPARVLDATDAAIRSVAAWAQASC